MMIFIIYSGLMLILTLLILITLRYKRDLFKNLDKKKYSYGFIYGTSAFIIDFFSRYIHKVNYESIKSRLSKININSADEKEAYIELVSKIALSVIVFYIIAVAGYIKCGMDTFAEEKDISALERPEYGEGEKSYNIILKDEDNEEIINIDVGERLYSKEETYEMFIKSYPKMIEVFLGNNEELDNITEDLNFISALDNGISIQWEIENTDYIDYSGNILWLRIEGKVSTKVTAVMFMGDYSQSYDINIVLNKEGREKKKLIDDEINQIVDNNYKEEKSINLKEIAEKYGVRFVDKKDKASLKYILYGLVISVLIFIAKGKDGEKELEKRKDELEADYASIITKFTILQAAGLNTVNAWDKIIEDYERQGKSKRFVYEEMKYARRRMKTGGSEILAYLEFGRRCGTHSYIKFANLLEQNLRKGAKGMKEILNSEVREALEERKVLARKRGDMAGTKLLLPMGIMLIISIAVIIVPALMAVNV